jgi:predicted anti-sigma-YlaC factor YlaD
VTCRELADWLADYFEGDVPPAARTVFDDHLARCENCRIYVEQVRTTLSAEAACYDDAATLPDELARAIRAAIQGART